MSTKSLPPFRVSALLPRIGNRLLTRRSFVAVACAALLMLGLAGGVSLLAAPLPGAIFTTDAGCNGVDLNIYASKDAVYLDGGPAHPGAAALTDGAYYVQVTEPDGTVLGTSVGTSNQTSAQVVNGEMLCTALVSMVSAVDPVTGALFAPPVQGFTDSQNPGGEYKVWVSTEPTFTNSSTKTDNFKVKINTQPLPNSLTITVDKFYDANVNGVYDSATESLLSNWRIVLRIGSLDYIRFTPVSMLVDPATDSYTVTESFPIESNWTPTTLTTRTVQVPAGATTSSTRFGNVCLGKGGGYTLGFWSNKNGQALIDATDLSALSGLNLRNADGSDFNPATYTQLRTWLLNGTATNMAYMLSVQFAAMKLNVINGKVSGGSFLYAPGTPSANSFGFTTVNALMADADASLGLYGVTTTTVNASQRPVQEAIKNALDRANNDQNFVQSSAANCPYNFAE